MAWENKFKKIAILDECLVETTTLCWKGTWVRMEFMRKNHQGSLFPDKNYAQIRNLDTNEIIAPCCMLGFELHNAFIWDDIFYLLATDYWGIYMSRSFDLEWWSNPAQVLNNHSTFIHHQNNSICRDNRRFVMAVDLLGGPYNFTICFCESYDMQNFRYIPGAVYKADMYTSSPKIYYIDGWYYLLHVRKADDSWWFEQFVSRSKDLLNWEDCPHNPVLSPNPKQSLHPALSPTLKYECCVSDLSLFERDNKTIGFFSGGTQEAFTAPTLQRAEYNGSMLEFFQHLYK